MRTISVSVLSLCLLGLLGAGCSGGQQAGGTPDSGKDETASSVQAGGGSGLKPCGLLSSDQVATVLPGHDGGLQVKAGGSLIEGVDAYQCSYSSGDADLLTVILNVAVDEERFEKIKPSSFGMSDAKKVDIADGGWVRGDDDDVKVTAIAGHTRIDVELMASGAQGKSNALVELTRQVIAQIE
jgi:hypothetical protein